MDFDISRQGASGKWQDDGEWGTAAVSTEDPALDAAKSAERRSEKERSLCGLCRRRFAGVSCVECRLAYCFRWAMRLNLVLFSVVGTGNSSPCSVGRLRKLGDADDDVDDDDDDDDDDDILTHANFTDI